MKKRLIKDHYKETLNEVNVFFSTEEFEEGNKPKRIDANFQTQDSGFYSGSYSITDKKVNHNMNNLSIDSSCSEMLNSINSKFQEIAASYEEGGVE